MGELEYILLFGLFHSVTYLVFSLGFSLVFGVARLPNLAYGSLYVLSSYLAHALSSYAGLEMYWAVPTAVLLAGAVSLVVGELVVKPALKMPVSVFITTMAVAYIVEEVLNMLMGLRPVVLSLYPGTSSILGIAVSNHWLLVVGVCILMVISLTIFLLRTSTGRAIRAVAESWEESMRLGIDPLRVLRVTFLVTGIYAGVTGVLLAPLKAMTPSAGWSPLFAAFAIVVLGGVGNLIGTVVASVIYGLLEQAVVYFLGGGIARVVPLLIVVLTLVVRPQGLLGRGE